MSSLFDIDPSEQDDFDDHKLIAFNFDKASGMRGYITIHRINDGHPSFGATRYWHYKSDKEALKDALRLSKTMSYKAAMAGLPGGGAKAVLINYDSTDKRKKAILREYARRVNYLSGKFVTGSDVGLTKEDVKEMKRISPYFVGTRVSPEKFTALGIYYSIKVSLKYIYGSDNLSNRSFSIQGLGKVGTELLKLLYEEEPTIYATDIDEKRAVSVKKNFPNISLLSVNTLHRRKVNVFSPCALSNCINFNNVSELSCDMVLGGANNQLEDKQLALVLHKMGILYCPDYVVNAGGLISVFDEYENRKLSVKRIKSNVKRVGKTLKKILTESEERKKSPLEVADEMAEKIFNGNK